MIVTMSRMTRDMVITFTRSGRPAGPTRPLRVAPGGTPAGSRLDRPTAAPPAAGSGCNRLQEPDGHPSPLPRAGGGSPEGIPGCRFQYPRLESFPENRGKEPSAAAGKRLRRSPRSVLSVKILTLFISLFIGCTFAHPLPVLLPTPNMYFCPPGNMYFCPPPAFLPTPPSGRPVPSKPWL